MPGNLRHYIPDTVNDTMITTFFESITVIKEYDYDSEIRQGASKLSSLSPPAAVLTLLPPPSSEQALSKHTKPVSLFSLPLLSLSYYY
jgi:hypothetical protein